MKRRGHATTTYRNPNGRGFMSKNSTEFIARALYAPDALSLASVLGRFFSNWSYFPGGRLAKYSISCWLISIMTVYIASCMPSSLHTPLVLPWDPGVSVSAQSDNNAHVLNVKNPCGSRDFPNQALLFLNCTPISFFCCLILSIPSLLMNNDNSKKK